MTAQSSVVSLGRPDFAVLGGGLCGRLVAWLLAGGGHRVALYERGDASGSGAAAWVAAAMLAPLTEAAGAEPLVVELGAASLDVWPRLVAQLPEPVFFQRNGTLVVWHRADRAEASLFERRVRANAPASLVADGGVLTLVASTRACCCRARASSTIDRSSPRSPQASRNAA
jgi:glycine oxidase